MLCVGSKCWPSFAFASSAIPDTPLLFVSWGKGILELNLVTCCARAPEEGRD